MRKLLRVSLLIRIMAIACNSNAMEQDIPTREYISLLEGYMSCNLQIKEVNSKYQVLINDYMDQPKASSWLPTTYTIGLNQAGSCMFNSSTFYLSSCALSTLETELENMQNNKNAFNDEKNIMKLQCCRLIKFHACQDLDFQDNSIKDLRLAWQRVWSTNSPDRIAIQQHLKNVVFASKLLPLRDEIVCKQGNEKSSTYCVLY